MVNIHYNELVSGRYLWVQYLFAKLQWVNMSFCTETDQLNQLYRDYLGYFRSDPIGIASNLFKWPIYTGIKWLLAEDILFEEWRKIIFSFSIFMDWDYRLDLEFGLALNFLPVSPTRKFFWHLFGTCRPMVVRSCTDALVSGDKCIGTIVENFSKFLCLKNSKNFFSHFLHGLRLPFGSWTRAYDQFFKISTFWKIQKKFSFPFLHGLRLPFGSGIRTYAQLWTRPVDS